MRPDMLITKTKLKTMKSLPKCGRDRWFIAECFYLIYTPKEATKQALLKYDTLHFNEMKPRGTLLLLEPLSINALVFAFVQKSLWSHPWLFSWGWDKTMLSVRKKSLLTADMRILDKENAVCRCMAFSIEMLQLRGQCQRKYKFPDGHRSLILNWIICHRNTL